MFSPRLAFWGFERWNALNFLQHVRVLNIHGSSLKRVSDHWIYLTQLDGHLMYVRVAKKIIVTKHIPSISAVTCSRLQGMLHLRHPDMQITSGDFPSSVPRSGSGILVADMPAFTQSVRLLKIYTTFCCNVQSTPLLGTVFVQPSALLDANTPLDGLLLSARHCCPWEWFQCWYGVFTVGGYLFHCIVS